MPGSSSRGAGGVLDGVLHQARPSCQRASTSVTMPSAGRRTARGRCGAPAPGTRGGRRPHIPVRAGRAGAACAHAASLIVPARIDGYRLRRESCPPLFAHRLRPARDRDPDLRLRGPDGGPRTPGDLRRAARVRPVRAHSETAQRPRAGRCCALAADPAAQGPSSDDLLALADAVRVGAAARAAAPGRTGGGDRRVTARHGHLRVPPPTDSPAR